MSTANSDRGAVGADDGSGSDEHRSQEREEQNGPPQNRDEDGKKTEKNGDKKEADAKKENEEYPKKPKWPFFVVGFIVVLAVAFCLHEIFKPRPDVWTDDAYVRVHYTSISPRIAGRIITVSTDDNHLVKRGDLLAEIDPRDYQTSVDSAAATVAHDKAQVGDLSANVERQPSLIDEQSASVESARARLTFARQDAKRFTNLAAAGSGTTQQRQQADTTLQQAQAQLNAAQASLGAAKKQLDALKAQHRAAIATVASAEAQLTQAKLNLSYTRIEAPIDGMVGARSVQAGDYVTAGQTLMAVVPLQKVYIEANYREVDLKHVRAEQDVTIHLDAYNIDLRGKVDGIGPASGVTFSPIAPEDATGNFTKIVQRLPVKIDVVPGQPLAKLLRVGMSVETTIHTGLEDVVGEQRDDPDRLLTQ